MRRNHEETEGDLNARFSIKPDVLEEVKQFCSDTSVAHIQIYIIISDVINSEPKVIKERLCKTKLVTKNVQSLPKYVFYELLEKLGFKDADVIVTSDYIACTIYPNN